MSEAPLLDERGMRAAVALLEIQFAEEAYFPDGISDAEVAERTMAAYQAARSPAPMDEPALEQAGFAAYRLLAKHAGGNWERWDAHYPDRRAWSVALARAIIDGTDESGAVLQRYFGIDTRAGDPDLADLPLPEPTAVERVVREAYSSASEESPGSDVWALAAAAPAFLKALEPYGDYDRCAEDYSFTSETVAGLVSAYEATREDGLDERWALQAAMISELRAFEDVGAMLIWGTNWRENAAWEHPKELATAAIGAYLQSTAAGHDQFAALRAAEEGYAAAFAQYQEEAEDDEEEEHDEPDDRGWLVQQLIEAYTRAVQLGGQTEAGSP